MRPSIRATAVGRWLTWMATWLASTRSSCRNRAAAKAWALPFPAMWYATSTSNSRSEGHVHRGQIGVYLRTVTPDLAEGLKLPRNHGVLLEDVMNDSSADRAGLKVGEVITSMGGKPVGDVKEFATMLFSYKIGQMAPIGVVRDGKEVTVEVKVTERPDDPQRFADMVAGPGNVVERLGIVGITINDDLKRASTGPSDSFGRYRGGAHTRCSVAGRWAGARRHHSLREHNAYQRHCRSEAGAQRASRRRPDGAAGGARGRTELPGDGVRSS